MLNSPTASERPCFKHVPSTCEATANNLGDSTSSFICWNSRYPKIVGERRTVPTLPYTAQQRCRCLGQSSPGAASRATTPAWSEGHKPDMVPEAGDSPCEACAVGVLVADVFRAGATLAPLLKPFHSAGERVHVVAAVGREVTLKLSTPASSGSRNASIPGGHHHDGGAYLVCGAGGRQT